ncbi:MAG TPA: diacylglycerol kinase family protein [Chloroflexaceae bacterium]|nr:diacylglycerol kinase family protein [Chloroflexaceae bacterium]
MERQVKHSTEQPGGPAARRPVDYSLGGLLAAFGYAFQGLWHLVSSQRNAQIHLLAGACALALGAALRIARWEWVALILTIALVLAAEGVNTAVEAAVDLATTARHPLAKVAKDVAAGTVLLCAIASVAVGCLVFLPHLLPLVGALLSGR